MEKLNDRLRGRDLKYRVFALLMEDDFKQAVKNLCALPGRRVINPLLSFLCSTEPQIRWRAITATGAVVANLAREDMESARVIMRRLIWNLNDESGGIGWGLPEAMGEIMARHEGLALEYSNILASYIQQDGNFLEFPPLQQGVLWGLGRLAQNSPELLSNAAYHLNPFLTSKDATLRALAAWVLGFVGDQHCDSELESLSEDEAMVRIYLNGTERVCRVGDLAREALKGIRELRN